MYRVYSCIVYKLQKVCHYVYQMDLSEKVQNELISAEKPGQPVSYRSFIPSIFISAALPLRDVKKTLFDRKYNNITLHLSSPNQVPYGKYGRLLLSVLTTHAVQSKNHLNPDGTVTIRYDTIQSLLDEMQLPKQRSGEIKEQLKRFKSATFIYEEEVEKMLQKSLFQDYFPTADRGLVQVKKISTGNIMFIDSMEYIEIDDGLTDKRSIAFTIVLNNKFIELCKNHSVPIDYTVYREISSALGKDLYAWLVYRNNSIGKDGLYIPRSSMVAQFMPVTKDQKDQERSNFKYIIEQINQIKNKYYPDLKFAVDKDYLGITIYKSPQIMNPKDTRYILVTNGMKETALKNTSNKDSPVLPESIVPDTIQAEVLGFSGQTNETTIEA